MFHRKGSVNLPAERRQSGNQEWWTEHTMSYDWKDKVPHERFTPEWYDDIDRRFLFGMRLVNGTPNPFVELMDLENLAGKRVLEIGCGMGFHTELMLRAGAKLTSIDLSPTSVNATRKRLEIKGIAGGDVRQMDAEKLEFPDAEFDMVWSWGVIHHSSHTGRILKEIDRVLKPGGDVRLMVYNLEGMPAYIVMMTRYALGFWRGRSLDELLWKNSDGFTARYYTWDGWRDLLSIFFDDIELRNCGQDSDAVPLPRHLRRWALKLVPWRRQEKLAARRGSLLFSSARKPLAGTARKGSAQERVERAGKTVAEAAEGEVR